MTDQKKTGAKPAMVSFVVLCICYMVPNYAQYQVSPMGTQIIAQYGLELSQLSSLFTAPMIPAIFFSLIGGLLIDQFGFKGVIGVGMALTAAGCVWRLFCGSYLPLFLATLLTGFSACFINAGGGKIIGSLFGASAVPAKMGILMAASTAGMTIANLTTAYFPTIDAAFTVSAVFAVVCAVLWFLFVRAPKQQETAAEVPEAGPGMGECLKVAMKSGSVWIVAFALFFIMAANVVIGSFLPTALSTRGVSETTAGTIAAVYTAGNFLGCVVAPAALKVLKSQKKVLLLFAILAAAGVAFAWQIPSIALLAIAMLLTGTFLGGLIPVLMGLPVQFAAIGPVYAGTAGGVIGTVQLLGAVLVPSYVLAPIAGDSFVVLYLLGGACVLIAGVLSQFVRDI